MKKIILSSMVVLGLLFAFRPVQAQNVMETKVRFDKKDVNGFVGQYQVPENDMDDIAGDYFSKAMNVKRKKSSGFYAYSGAHWQAIPLNVGDIYYKVDGNKNHSTLTVLVSKGYGNFISTATDSTIANAINKFYSDFDSNIAAYLLSKQIESQKDLISKMEGNYADGLKKESKLKAKVSELQADIENNKKDYEQKAEEITKNKQILVDLQSKQK